MNDTALKVSQSLYCFSTFICHIVENYFPRLWGTGISDAISIYTTKIYKSLKRVYLCFNSSLCPPYRYHKNKEVP